MILKSRRLPHLLLASLLVLAACDDSGTEPDPGPGPQPELFDTYVALGNSITAGFESGGLNGSTQMHAYPVLLAELFDASFQVALVQRPGCPPPLTGPFPLTDERVAGASPTSCAGLLLPVPQQVQSLAFPAFKIADVLTVPGGVEGLLYQLAFGDRTLVEAMIQAEPTLVSVWLGNSDALTAGTTGDTTFLTPAAEFTGSLSQIVSAIANQTSALDAVLIGVTDPQLAPVVQPGAYFWTVAQEPEIASLLSISVNDDCAPFTPTGQSNPQAANLVSFNVLADDAVAEVSCADDAPYVLNAEERQTITSRVAAFNAAIQSRAEAEGWIYLDANALLQAQLADAESVRKCQGLATATTPEQVEAAVRATCPTDDAPDFFGSLISFDGIHPSLAGHRVVADALATAIRARHEDL